MARTKHTETKKRVATKGRVGKTQLNPLRSPILIRTRVSPTTRLDPTTLHPTLDNLTAAIRGSLAHLAPGPQVSLFFVMFFLGPLGLKAKIKGL